jgi:signal transduction histidine kinase
LVFVAVEWKPSVRTQVTVGATVVVIVALVVAAALVAVRTRQALADDVDAQLVDRVTEVEVLIQQNRLTAVLEPTGLETGQVQVFDVDGGIVALTPGLAGGSRLNVVPPPAPGVTTHVTVEGDRLGAQPEQHYRIVARTVDSPAGPLAVYALTSLAGPEAAEHHLRDSLLFGVPAMAAVAGLLTHRVVGRALAPVESMRREVDRIEATDLSGRVAAPATDDEIARLGETLNRMLARLEESVSRQQLFAAAASHELRSPLSAIRTELEVSLTYPDRAEWPQVASDVLIEVNRLENLSRDLRILTTSQVVTGSSLIRFDLAAVLRNELDRRQVERDLIFTSQLAGAEVTADLDAVTRVVRNLLDNAERHARHQIAVSAGSDAEGSWFSVANDGAPVPELERERIFEPFLRLDEARTLDAGGSGLGLAIARSIMASHGGSLALVTTAEGPSFLARFPSPSSVGGC